MQAGAGLAVGRNGICVHEHGADHFPAVLVYSTSISDWTHVAVVYRDGTPSLFVNGKLVRTGLKSGLVVHPGVGVPHTRSVVPFQGQLADVRQFGRALDAAEIATLASQVPDPASSSEPSVIDLVHGEIWQPGDYELETANGHRRQIHVSDLPSAIEIQGPWQVRFDPRWGGPESVIFETLNDWSKRPEDGIRYYSGTAVYRKTFQLDPGLAHSLSAGGSPNSNQHCLYLDLGEVDVMADVTLNGRPLGVVWKKPYRLNISDVVKAGDNILEVKVANLWVNRQIGDQHLPEDSDRNPNGTLKRWPEWLQQGKPSPTGRLSFTTWRLWKKDDPLQASGLLGPVTLQVGVKYQPSGSTVPSEPSVSGRDSR